MGGFPSVELFLRCSFKANPMDEVDERSGMYYTIYIYVISLGRYIFIVFDYLKGCLLQLITP